MGWWVGVSGGCVCRRRGGRLPRCQNLGMSLGNCCWCSCVCAYYIVARNITKTFVCALVNLTIIHFVLGMVTY